ncbi:MAG: sensor histidine kinase [Synechococcaceae bacterium WB6_3B_236]|nr:sensor histidine kinase [Synechococcaceae bacterium WB6_3B_236]
MWLQLAIIVIRHIETLYGHAANSNGDSMVDNINFDLAIAFAPAYLFVFLGINKLLINAFAHAEYLRANQLEQSRQELQRKLKTSLVASSVAHEINYPLSTMALNIHLATEDLEKIGAAAAPIQIRLNQLAVDSRLVVSTIETMRTLLRNVQTEHSEKQIKLQVADNGPGFMGINLEQLPLQTTKRQGSGLGLYVVRTAVENHGGSMSIGRSEKLGGAEITLIFPTITRC